jgi:hypothetical protein
MQQAITRACLSVAAASVFAGAMLAQAADPQVGTWKLNVAKSTYSPGPAPKSGTSKIEAAGAGTKVVVDQVLADGTTRHWQTWWPAPESTPTRYRRFRKKAGRS